MNPVSPRTRPTHEPSQRGNTANARTPLMRERRQHTNAVNTPTKQERFPTTDGARHNTPRGGYPKPTHAEPHRTPCQLRRRGRTGQDTLQKPFFGVLDWLSRRTLIPLPPSAERPSETPLFDSTPPADTAMAVARSAARPSTARLCDTARRTPARHAANRIPVRRRASVWTAMCGVGSHPIAAMVGAVVSASFQRF